MERRSNGPQIHSFNFTASNLHITFAQPTQGAQKSANLQHIEQCPIPSIEPEIKQEPEESTPTDGFTNRDLFHQLPIRSRSGEVTALLTSSAPDGDKVEPVSIFTTSLPWQDEEEEEEEDKNEDECGDEYEEEDRNEDEDRNKDEDETSFELQMASIAAEDERGPANLTCNFEDDSIVFVESPAHNDHDPSPSPNSPLVSSLFRIYETSPEPIIYAREGSEDEVELRSLGGYIDVKKKRSRPHQSHEHPEAENDYKESRTANSKRMKTVSPNTDRLLTGRHLPHSWSMLEREAVILLRTFTESSWDEITEILRVEFSTLSFRKEIVSAQWAEWSFAFREESQYDAYKRWQELRASFEAAAQQCGFELRSLERDRRRRPATKREEHKHTGHRRTIRNWLLRGKGPKPPTPNARDMSPLLSSPLRARSTLWSTLLRGAEYLPESHSTQDARDDDGLEASDALLVTPATHRTNYAIGDESEASSPHSNNSPPSPETKVRSPYFFESKRSRPRLLFRVYHSGMPGENSPNGFRSGRRRQIPRAGTMDLPSSKRELLDQAMIHLMGFDYSCFVATTTSLIWSIYQGLERNRDREKDYRIGQQHIALIDADRIPDSTVYHAGSLIGAIKTDQEEPSRKSSWIGFKGRNYKGHCEWMIWGEIPPCAILFDVPLEKLMTATSATTHGTVAIAEFLSLQHLSSCAHQVEAPLPRARKAFNSTTDRVGHDLSSKRDGIMLGQVTTLFGFSISSDPELLTAFVHSVCQGWAMMTAGVKAITEVASGFLEELEQTSGGGGGGVEAVDDEVARDIVKAVQEGLEKANREVSKERKPQTSPWKRRRH
ncbi:uncharacterized protein IWZ02DRAFT_449192 [Phyllosticta citriasiana]|uniref:uncharacterized protein n=1 Tax=Phyllosticta citriasiana TaxID=595635 RepID=UPI0030FD6028